MIKWVSADTSGIKCIQEYSTNQTAEAGMQDSYAQKVKKYPKDERDVDD